MRPRNKKRWWPWPLWLSWSGVDLCAERSAVRSWLKACAQVGDLILGGGVGDGSSKFRSHIHVLFSFSLSLFKKQ